MHPLGAVTIVVVVLYILAREIAKRVIDAKLQALYATNRYDECIELLNKPVSRILQPTYQQYLQRFTVYEAKRDDKAALFTLDTLLGLRLSKRHRLMVVTRAFNYYVRQGKGAKSKEMLDEIAACGNRELVADCRLTYAIVFSGEHGYIVQMESLLEKAVPEQKAKLCFLLSKQYANAGDREKAREYRRLAEGAEKELAY
jgi:hypothetical protein